MANQAPSGYERQGHCKFPIESLFLPPLTVLAQITRGIHTDCLLNYDTVKYFGGEQHEGERYRKAIAEYQALEYKVITSLNLLNFIQNLIIVSALFCRTENPLHVFTGLLQSIGLLVGSLIVAHRVVYAGLSSADYVFFITYLIQVRMRVTR